MRWFRVYTELLDYPKFIKLAPELRSELLMMWCVAAANDGRLPPLEDVAIKFRMPEARAEKLIDDLRRYGFIDDDEPHNWAGRQFKSGSDATGASRSKRYTERKRVTRDGERDDTLASHPPEQTQNQNRAEQEQIGVTRHALVEVLDEAALRAWDDYGRLTTRKPCPRNRRGGWRFPTMWPSGHEGWCALAVARRVVR